MTSAATSWQSLIIQTGSARHGKALILSKEWQRHLHANATTLGGPLQRGQTTVPTLLCGLC